jgi:glutaredoxin-related protein
MWICVDLTELMALLGRFLYIRDGYQNLLDVQQATNLKSNAD